MRERSLLAVAAYRWDAPRAVVRAACKQARASVVEQLRQCGAVGVQVAKGPRLHDLHQHELDTNTYWADIVWPV